MPRIVELEKRLGFKWDRGISINSKESRRVEPLRSLMDAIQDLNNRFVGANLDLPRCSQQLTARIEQTFFDYGDVLWPPPPADTSDWLVDAHVNNWGGLYPKNLVFQDEEDREKLWINFHALLLEKCSRHQIYKARQHQNVPDDASVLSSEEDDCDEEPENSPVASDEGEEVSRSRVGASLEATTRSRDGSLHPHQTCHGGYSAAPVARMLPSRNGTRASNYGNGIEEVVTASKPTTAAQLRADDVIIARKRPKEVDSEDERAEASSSKEKRVCHTFRPTKIVTLRLTPRKLRAVTLAGTDGAGREKPQKHLAASCAKSPVPALERPDETTEPAHQRTDVSFLSSQWKGAIVSNDRDTTPICNDQDNRARQAHLEDSNIACSDDHIDAENDTSTTRERRGPQATHTANGKQRTNVTTGTTSMSKHEKSPAERRSTLEYPGLSRIKSMTMHFEPKILVADEPRSVVNLEFTKQALLHHHDHASGEIRIAVGAESIEKCILTAEGPKQHFHANAPQQEDEPSNTKGKEQEAGIITDTEAIKSTAGPSNIHGNQPVAGQSQGETASQSASIPASSMGDRQGVLNIQLRCQECDFLQFIRPSMEANVQDLFHAIQKRMNHRLNKREIQRLKLRRSGVDDEAKPWLFEQDDPDTWAIFCDRVKGSAVEGVNLWAVADVET